MNDAAQRPKRRTPEQRRERTKKSRLPEITPDTPWRLFIAVPLPNAVRDQLSACIDHLSSNDLPVRWTDPANGHLTLHFLGEIEPEMGELLRMTMRAPVAPHVSFELRTAEPGAFPSLKRPRVLWLGLWGPTHRLEALYNDLGDFLDDFGIEIDEEPLHPHITLGRVRDTEGVKVGALPEQIREAFAQLEEHHLAGKNHQVSFPVTEVQLIRSYLEQDGPRYEVLATYLLQTAGSNPDNPMDREEVPPRSQG
ncbi:MAG: RNA 2',3'-cyclic phosphodiesterase [Thermomicrobiales bacterium]|nr:RNA 2',3'-cyclic phosphodiesterase [Thermomicrobiales bacterium]MCO5228448.1 RNA 2',3'-cyclic phosphodiesterase [Thermomicrobiales bacterium]